LHKVPPNVPMFPWKYFFFMKLERSDEIKRELFPWGEVPKLVHSPEVWEHARAYALGCPSLRRTHSYGNLPYNQHFSSQSFRLLIKPSDAPPSGERTHTGTSLTTNIFLPSLSGYSSSPRMPLPQANALIREPPKP
jgi:hypothetical protein